MTDTFRALLDQVADMAEQHVSPYLGHAEAWEQFLDQIGAALRLGPQGDVLPPGYIDPEHTGEDRQMLETFYAACRSEGGTADEIHLRGLRAALAAKPQGDVPTDEELLSVDQLSDSWNAQADVCNSWDELGVDEIIWWAQRQALARWGRPARPAAEALAARPLLEQVARMGDRIGQHTVGEIVAISNRARNWLQDNPPGQPVAIEPCVEPAE